MKSFPFTLQHDSMDCGPTCLWMVARYYNLSCSLQSLRDKMQIGKEGVSMLAISEAAETLGFNVNAAKISFESLANEAPLPCILHWRQNHFVVLYKVGKKLLHVADPATGLIALPPQDLIPLWTSGGTAQEEEGLALLLEPAGNQEKQAASQKNALLAFNNIYKYLRPHKKLIVQLLVGLMVASIIQLIPPFLAQSVIDVGIDMRDLHFIYVILIAQLALIIGRLSVDFMRSWILLYISNRINISILTDFLIKLMKLPVAFFESKRTGDILQRMNDHQRIETFLTGSSVSVLFSLTNLVIFSFILAVFNTYIFIFFLGSNILYAFWILVFLKKRKALDYQRFDIASNEQSISIQLVQGMQDIKLNGVQDPMRWNWERQQVKMFKLNMKGLALSQWQQTGAFFMNEGKNMIITFLSASAVIRGNMTLGGLLAIQYIIGQLNSPIEQMVSFIQNWQNARISMDRLNEIHSIEDEEPAERQLLRHLPVLQGKAANIFFDQVSFTYPGAGNEPVLNNINMEIPLGKTTAIVGSSGSGKTTLLKLLLKFHEPQKGKILLGNTPLKSISHAAWRDCCGVVMQDSFIFSDSIARNITMAAENDCREKLNNAISAANIKEFIDGLPLGLSTKIGMEGAGISMGQRQRILIARAVYKDPGFIFLDEATNSLDAINEVAILKNLDNAFKGRTVVVVAHRLSTVKNAHQIVVLNKGVISERGTHHELIRRKGQYYKLVKDQLELGE